MKLIEKQLFQQNLLEFLSKIPKEQINYFQFFMILQQLSIVFASADEALKYRKLFKTRNFIHKNHLVDIMDLQHLEIRNNQPLYIISIPHDAYEKDHKAKKCFNFWAQLMKDKYGSQLRWFQQISLNKDAISLKLFTFKERIASIMKNTIHQKCVDNICLFFPKTRRNQIQWGIFMNVIRGVKNLSKSIATQKGNSIALKTNSSVDTRLGFKAMHLRAHTQMFSQHLQKEHSNSQINQQETQQIKVIKNTFSNYDNPVDINLIRQNIQIQPTKRWSQRILKKSKNLNTISRPKNPLQKQTVKTYLYFSNKKAQNIVKK